MSDVKVVKYVVEGTKLIVTVDPNKDGAPVLKLELSITEVFNEILSAIQK